jgi:sigma-B regulation protein RsbU (phosphoserine phosphatase)
LRKTIKILILDNSKEDVERISKCLMDNGYTMPIVACGDEKSYVTQLDEWKPDVVLCEHVLPSYNSFRALDIVRHKYPDIIFIIVSGEICEEFALELLKEGVDDYVLKNRLLRLPHSIESAYIKRRHKEESEKLVQANTELLNANKIIDLKNKHLMQSIMFAERIQSLTLPKIDTILKEFPEAFIYYKPKDIVSGDFYWTCNKNNRFMTVLADCTGHGVSGALLSIIGSNFLNEIMEHENKFNYPTDILSLLDKNLRKLLQQDVNSGYQDGIDIAFISIDKVNKKLYFSGCKRPILIYKKREKKIIEYKGEPYLIGGVDDNVIKTFRTQEISYRAGDVIYMFTDGCVDQFGGPNNKKLMKERFIDMLLSFKHLELNYQGQLLEQKINKWRGNFEQTDDILVMGIKLQ